MTPSRTSIADRIATIAMQLQRDRREPDKVLYYGQALRRLAIKLRNADLPPDLARVLSDPTIVIDRDREIRLTDGRTLAEHMHEWANAPSNTASAD